MPYDPSHVEARWERIWRERGTYRTPNAEDLGSKPKYYVLDMFPYPSGHGLHVGHLKGYVASDIVARFRRMRGYNVLHPMGWDSFGLPTERQAEKDGIAPSDVTRRNIEVFKAQLNAVGMSYDWDKELATSDPSFFRWTQWIFLLLLKRGLAYQAEVPVNWCPALGTVLANEEVKDGVYIETGDSVERKTMRQWMLRITAYADRLLEDLDLVDWPNEVKELQRNWIGKRDGATVRFEINETSDSFEVFSTRPETLFGCTFCVLAPEHALALRISTPGKIASVQQYIRAAIAIPERERLARQEHKTGVFTGAFAVNPVNDKRVPIYIADYVLGTYGTGAIFGCPAHDERDFEFAQEFSLEIVPVVSGPKESSLGVHTGEGTLVNSGFLNGLSTAAAKAKVIETLESQGRGEARTTYALRDWLFSRQRYWGEPIPVVHGPKGEIEPIPEEQLPVRLPSKRPISVEPSEEAPIAPLARDRHWTKATLPSSGGPAQRETNVMPQWAGSCWYYLRFIDPQNSSAAWDPILERAWMPVDLYVGGIEHATLHLLYARFWHKVLFDAGYVSTPEPFQGLFNQGMIHARSYQDKQGRYYYPEEVEERGGSWFTKSGIGPLESRIEKMSKSRYNVVSPESVIQTYGADSLRLYEVFMGPLEDNAIWQTDGVVGMRRFLDRVWRASESMIIPGGGAGDPALERSLHRTIRKVTDDLAGLRLNTAISQLMIFINEVMSLGRVSAPTFVQFVKLLAPFAPHICAEMWERLGKATMLVDESWPTYDPRQCDEDDVTIVVQINGRVRTRISAPRNASEVEVKSMALGSDVVRRWICGAPTDDIRVFHVPNKLINIVTTDA
jgi:leucyl-tRNA synthetase